MLCHRGPGRERRSWLLSEDGGYEPCGFPPGGEAACICYPTVTKMEQIMRYTSKASFLDRDPLPQYEKGVSHVFSGTRIGRDRY